jgi:CubicO group peptidase (beta-lactamase class C family)
MFPDDLQKTWQSQHAGRLTIDPQLVLQQVRRNQQTFRTMIVCRDFREVFVGLLLVPVSVFMAYKIDGFALSIGAAGLSIAGYILIDRWRFGKRTPAAAEPLIASIDESLRDIEHQIWLLRNIFWWYLLPCVIACAIVMASTAVSMSRAWDGWGDVFAKVGFQVLMSGIFAAVFYSIYRLNQRAVDAELVPRRNELLALRQELIQPNDQDQNTNQSPPSEQNKGTKSMLRITLSLIISVVLLPFLIGVYQFVQFERLKDPAAAAESPSPASAADLGGARDVGDLLDPIRQKHKLPALAAAMVKDGKLVALGAVGVRRAGGTEPVTIHDRFHIGSCTKSMTAMLCAILIEEGKLQWDSTIGEVFADQEDKIRPEYRGVTLEQLLTHRSGLPEDRQPDRVLWPKIRALNGPMLAQRRALVELALSREPAAAPGSKHLYSNIGYTLAGAMCERVTNQSWEDLMRERLFKPLEMTTAGFGPPGTAEKVNAPWGHLFRGATWTPIPPGPKADNPLVIGPAGTVHCSLADWAKFAALHLQVKNNAIAGKSLVTAETLRKLQTSLPGDDYAFGWAVRERGWAGGRALMHTGSNTMWYADIWVAPERGIAFLAATNAATDNAFPGCDAAISALIRMAGTF